MSPRIITDFLRGIPGGAPAISQSNVVDVKAHEDDRDLEANIDTDADGKWTWTYVPEGSAAAGWILDPGPLYWEGVYAGQTRSGSSHAAPNAGPISILELPEVFKAFGNGVVDGQFNEFAVTYDTAGLDLDINTGRAVLDGQLVTNPATRELNLAAADATHPRIDRVILEKIRTAGDTYGKTTLKILAGTPAASPAATALTNDAARIQMSLAQARVNAAATTVFSVTDERQYTVTGISRNESLITTVIDNTGGTLSTVAATLSTLSHTPTLVSNVFYDILVEASIIVDGASAVAQLACFIDGTGNLSDYVTAPAQDGVVTISNAHTLTVLGTGAAVTIGCRALRTSTANTVTWFGGSSRILCIPRT